MKARKMPLQDGCSVDAIAVFGVPVNNRTNPGAQANRDQEQNHADPLPRSSSLQIHCFTHTKVRSHVNKKAV